MQIKKKVVNGFKMALTDRLPMQQKILIRIAQDENGITLSLSDNDETVALTVAFEEIEKLMKEDS